MYVFFLYNVIVNQILVTYAGSWFFLVFQGQKSLALDTAIGMWQLLFAEKQWPLVDHWCQFLQVAYYPYFYLMRMSSEFLWPMVKRIL